MPNMQSNKKDPASKRIGPVRPFSVRHRALGITLIGQKQGLQVAEKVKSPLGRAHTQQVALNQPLALGSL